MRQKSFLAFAFLLVSLGPGFAVGHQAATICDLAAQHASQQSGVPLSVLLSIARVETGTSVEGALTPWPWTVNVAGKGYFFATKDEAVTFSGQELDAGNINFDVGCFQVNLRWHSKGFTSLENAFDPAANASYAANFLAKLYAESGTWSGAVAAYHSRTPEHAEVYLEKVKSVWQDLKTSGYAAQGPAVKPPKPRVNTFPLLQAGVGMNGSLVPQNTVLGTFGLR